MIDGYESPIKIVTDKVQIEVDNNIYKAVQNAGINVDKAELIKALKYDRDQYYKGYADGQHDARQHQHAHWKIDTKFYFNDDGDCVVYSTAKCSKCHSKWHNNYSICYQMIRDYDYEQEIETPITEERINDAKNDCKQVAEKRILELAPFCEQCGAKMDEEAEK